MFKPANELIFYINIKMFFVRDLVSETTYRKYDGPCENRRTVC